MDYSQLSDLEINQRVSNVIPGRFIFYSDYVWDSEWEKTFDPCNSAADAWPIIESNRIGVMPSEMKTKELWMSTSGRGSYAYHENPLRAAMIVFLMKRDANHA